MSPNKTGPKRDKDLEGSVGFDFTENVFFSMMKSAKTHLRLDMTETGPRQDRN